MISNAGFGAVSFSFIESGADLGKSALVQAPFSEDAFVAVDRNHEFNGAAFTATGTLIDTQFSAPLGTITTNLPSYLIGNQYIANANTNRDNANYSLSLTLNSLSTIYLLLDNRIGDNNNLDAASPALAGMSWVSALGFSIVSTGLSPFGQPDYVGLDESSPVITDILDPSLRTHTYTNLGIGAGVSLNQFSTVYALTAGPGTVVLGAQNDGVQRQMYGVVIGAASVADSPSTAVLLGVTLTLLPWLSRRGTKRS